MATSPWSRLHFPSIDLASRSSRPQVFKKETPRAKYSFFKSSGEPEEVGTNDGTFSVNVVVSVPFPSCSLPFPSPRSCTGSGMCVHVLALASSCAGMSLAASREFTCWCFDQLGMHPNVSAPTLYLMRNPSAARASSTAPKSTSSNGRQSSLRLRGFHAKRPSLSAAVHSPANAIRSGSLCFTSASYRSACRKNPGLIVLMRAIHFTLSIE